MEGPALQPERNPLDLPPLHQVHHLDSSSAEFTMPSREGDVRFSFTRKNGKVTYLGAEHGGSEQLRPRTLQEGAAFARALFTRYDNGQDAETLENGDSSENEIVVGKIIMECRKRLGDSEEDWHLSDIRQITTALFPELSHGEVEEMCVAVLRSVEDTRRFTWGEK